ncbi:metal-dependent phosphohydrolase [Actinocrinis puniceicyclus]|uniref:Metal-dependent phosphohydrolase n=2 Tax=Actinocrinis puniceicyclus TaxID=977794 RepID=A0A8J7WT86_9ACTN|nr:metal-dependent phosphohydrolase [Actinocrinis puniceicyclus]
MTCAHDDQLVRRWVELAGEPAARFGRELISRYREPHRRYHTAEHLARMLDFVDFLEAGAESSGPVPRTPSIAVRYAVWFHDAVYQVDGPGSSGPGNEERSARLAGEVLRAMGLPGALAVEVSRLVRCTAEHRVHTTDHDGAVLCDADLAILGSGDRAYRRYAEQIRQEYRAVPEPQFRAGRAAVLRSLLGRIAIYNTARARALLESKARVNIAAELERLTTRA